METKLHGRESVHEVGITTDRTAWVVIPAFNEALTIADVAKSVLLFSPNLIVVDDGSSDGTADQLTGLPVTVLRNQSNRGKGSALIAGFTAALAKGATRVVTLDGDGQHRPEDIPAFLACAVPNPDAIVIGSRLADRAMFPAARYKANRIASFWISWACGYPIEDTQSGFRVYPANILREVLPRAQKRHGFVFESEILIEAARAGFLCINIPIPALYGQIMMRPSHFRPGRDVTRIVIMVAKKLLARGLYPQGLARAISLKRSAKHDRIGACCR